MPTKQELVKKYIKNKSSTWKLAEEYSVSQTTIIRWLIKLNIPRRSYKENKTPVLRGSKHNWGDKISKSMIGNTNSKIGKDHWKWSGDNIGYRGVHNWIQKHYGNPEYCEHCKKSSKKRYEWANISGKYLRNPIDWLRLCTSCHKKYDKLKK